MQNITTEQPLNGCIRIVNSEYEIYLGTLQGLIWRKISENGQLTIGELYQLLISENINISYDELVEVVSVFLRYGLVVIRDELW